MKIFCFFRLFKTEIIKLHRSMVLRLLCVIPLIFVVLDFWLVGRSLVSLRDVTKDEIVVLGLLPLKAVSILWVSYFHPLLLALLPALLFRPEHRYGLWKHLHTLPVSRRWIYVSKGLMLFVLCVVTLGLVTIGLWVEWSGIMAINPRIASPFPWKEMITVFAWMLVGSLPLLALYLWISDRINSAAVPIVLGLIGIMLNISLSGQELDPSWRRDFIPWILPYTCAQQAIEQRGVRQETPIAAEPFKNEIDLGRLVGTQEYRLPSGRKVTTTTEIPDYYLLPPPPTPKSMLFTFSIGAAFLILSIGFVDAGRERG